MTSEYAAKKQEGTLSKDGKSYSVREIIQKGTTSCEMCWWYLGIIMACLSGLSSPGAYIVFGAIIENVGNRPGADGGKVLTAEELEASQLKAWEQTQITASGILIVAVYTWIVIGLMIFGMNYAASKASYRIKI